MGQCDWQHWFPSSQQCWEDRRNGPQGCSWVKRSFWPLIYPPSPSWQILSSSRCSPVQGAGTRWARKSQEHKLPSLIASLSSRVGQEGMDKWWSRMSSCSHQCCDGIQWDLWGISVWFWNPQFKLLVLPCWLPGYHTLAQGLLLWFSVLERSFPRFPIDTLREAILYYYMYVIYGAYIFGFFHIMENPGELFG